MAQFVSPVTTKSGLSLLAKTHLGVYGVKFTRIGVGAGSYDIDINNREEIQGITALSGEMQSVDISSIKVINETVVRVRGVLSNKELRSGYEITSVGLFAYDYDSDMEILYSVVLFTKYDYFPAFDGFSTSSITLTYFTAVGNTDSLIINIEPDAVASAIDLQELMDEFALFKQSNEMYPLAHMFLHGLNDYPVVRTLEVDQGYGQTGYGHGPYGGGNVKTLKNSIEYTDRNNLVISVGKKYNEVKSVTRINPKEYIVLFNDSTLSLFVVLVTDCVNSEAESDSSIATGVTTFNGRAGDVTLIDKDIPATIARKADIQSTVQEAVQAELYDVSIDAGEV